MSGHRKLQGDILTHGVKNSELREEMEISVWAGTWQRGEIVSHMRKMGRRSVPTYGEGVGFSSLLFEVLVGCPRERLVDSWKCKAGSCERQQLTKSVGVTSEQWLTPWEQVKARGPGGGKMEGTSC